MKTNVGIVLALAFLVGLIVSLAKSTSVVARQLDSPSVEELERRLAALKKHTDAERNMEAAFECAALAVRFDNDERQRLLRFGYAEGQTFIVAVLQREIDSDLDSLVWEDTPFNNPREFIAFQLGQMYGKYEERFFRDIPYEGAAYEQEYNNRNCALIGE